MERDPQAGRLEVSDALDPSRFSDDAIPADAIVRVLPIITGTSAETGEALG